jgi:hypothetical protein
VPILFGNAREDPNSTWLGIRRAVSFAFGRPDWKANEPAAAETPKHPVELLKKRLETETGSAQAGAKDQRQDP